MQKTLSFFLFTLLLTALIAFSGQNMNAALAQDETNTPSPSPILEVANPTIFINEHLGDATTKYIGFIRVTVTHVSTKLSIALLADDLKMEGELNKAVVISRENIAIGNNEFASDGTNNIQITVQGVTKQGTYTGDIKLLLPGQTEKDGRLVTIKLVVSADPQFVDPPQVKLNIVDCRGGLLGLAKFDCWLARGLLISSVLDNTWYLGLNNSGDASAELDIENSAVIIRNNNTQVIVDPKSFDFDLCDSHTKTPPAVVNMADKTRANSTPSPTQIPSEGQTDCDKKQIIPKQGLGSIGIKLTGDGLSPGQYTGIVSLGFRGMDGPVKVPVELSVRVGPICPAIALMIGFIISMLIARLGSPTVKLQLKFLRKIVRLQVEELLDADAKAFMLAQITYFKDRLEDAKEIDEDKLNTEFNELKERIAKFKSLDRLQELVSIASWIPDEIKDNYNKEIQDRRNDLMGPEYATKVTNEIIDDLSRRINNRTQLSLQGDVTVRNRNNRSGGDSTLWSLPQRLEDWYKSLDALPFLSRVTSILVIVGLLYVGLATQYANANSTFGANIMDYFSLIVWGALSNVTVEGLSAVLKSYNKTGNE